jgi:RimJ/RimL family protein N-acetyltransferase
MIDARNYRVEETLPDGTRIVFRAARPDDRARITNAFQALDRESVYTRFFTYKNELSDAELARLDTTDFVHDVLLVATIGAGPDETVIAGARYNTLDPASGASAAEIAFTVEEDYQGQGIAGRLLAHLISIARAAGIVRFEADVLTGNAPMLAVFSRCNLPMRQRREGGIAHVELALTTEQPSAPVGKP